MAPNPDYDALAGLINDIKYILENPGNGNIEKAPALLKQAKLLLLKLNLLVPTDVPSIPTAAEKAVLQSARYVFELGALVSLRLQDPTSSQRSQLDNFVRYYHQVQPFYGLPSSVLDSSKSFRNRLTGLYMAHLLTEGDYAGFHSLVEQLEIRVLDPLDPHGSRIFSDPDIQYPMQLEKALMEGDYNVVNDRIKERSPERCVEFMYFSEVLGRSVRREIAKASAKTYQSMPLQMAQTLFFLNESTVQPYLKHELGWKIDSDWRVYPRAVSSQDDVLAAAAADLAMHDSDDEDEDDQRGPDGISTGLQTDYDDTSAEAISMTEQYPLMVSMLKYAQKLESII